MISAALYAVYLLAASAALVRGTATATAAGAGVAVYLLLRLVWSLHRRQAAPAHVAASAAVALPVSRPSGSGQP